jgi:RNA ligase
MFKLHSYPSIYSFGHRMVIGLLQDPVYVQEKVDGSQFSFGLDTEGNVVTRSKGAELFLETADKLFKGAVEYVHSIKDKLTPGYTYRGEVLHRPKHNTLAYDRVPRHNVVIFDVNTGDEIYMPYSEVVSEANRLDLEVVPLLYAGMVESADKLRSLLETMSFLGGQKVEGVVVKPIGYGQFGPDKKALMGKYVSEAFKEIHGGEWRKNNPSNNEIVEKVALIYKTPARWDKAIQHLREAGQIEDSPRDIGKILKEIHTDTLKECEAEIKDELFKAAWPKIGRIITAGFPEFYKERLLNDHFEKEKQCENQNSVA